VSVGSAFYELGEEASAPDAELVGPPAADPSDTDDGDGAGAPALPAGGSAVDGAIFSVVISSFDSMLPTKAATTRKRTTHATVRAMFDYERRIKVNNTRYVWNNQVEV
jgi:hypothetical protein